MLYVMELLKKNKCLYYLRHLKQIEMRARRRLRETLKTNTLPRQTAGSTAGVWDRGVLLLQDQHFREGTASSYSIKHFQRVSPPSWDQAQPCYYSSFFHNDAKKAQISKSDSLFLPNCPHLNRVQR